MAATPAANQSALRDVTVSSNGRYSSHRKIKLLTRDRLDGRTSGARLFDQIVRDITSLGGDEKLSTVQRNLIAAFAGASCHVEHLNGCLLLGEPIDISQYSQAVSSLVRISSRLGLQRVPKAVESLTEYLERRRDEKTIEHDEVEEVV